MEFVAWVTFLVVIFVIASLLSGFDGWKRYR